ncbi:MAG: AsmA family protein [Betaproteobacteria bacterium]|nr:AsmA family protein [Betaproteobacteria bacterium]
MKAIKHLLYGIGGLVLVAVLGVGAALVIVDGTFVKSRLERMMKEKNRTLVIEGTPALKLFPVARIALGKTTLSEPGSDKLFVSLDSAEVALRVMPLMSGEAAVEVLKVAGLKVNVVKARDGRFNFADLAEGGKGGEDKAGHDAHREPPKLRIADINVERMELAYRDEATGQEARVSDFNFKTGRLDGSAPGPVSLSARITGRKPDMDLTAKMAGALRFDLARQEIAFDGLSFSAKGKLDRDTLVAELAAPKVEITPAKASGAEVKGTVQVKGPQRNVSVVLRIEGIQGTARDLALAAVALDIDASAEGNSVKGRVSTPVKGNLQARTWELPKIAANLTIAGPAIPQKTVTLPINAAARADLGKQTASLEVSMKFDESSIQAKLAATKFEPLATTFDVGIDKLNLDRYIPAQSKDAKKGDDRVDLSPLKGKTVSGKIAIGNLTAQRVKLQNVKAEVKLAGGKLEVSPHSANLYGGTVSGALVADANGNRIAVKEILQNVALGPLLRDAAQKDEMEGKGNVSVDVQTAGGTVPALKKALAGAVKVEVKDGAIKGVNLADSARNLKSALGAKQTKPDPTQKTDFSEMSASFAIKNGVARNDDLKAASPFLRLGGAGNLDIGNNTIDYLAKATLAATTKGQGGRDAKDLTGITIPVKLTGALDKPDWNIDYTALLAASGGALGKAADSVTEMVKKSTEGAGGVGGKIKGLFGR